jgi:hypothetical protein
MKALWCWCACVALFGLVSSARAHMITLTYDGRVNSGYDYLV